MGLLRERAPIDVVRGVRMLRRVVRALGGGAGRRLRAARRRGVLFFSAGRSQQLRVCRRRRPGQLRPGWSRDVVRGCARLQRRALSLAFARPRPAPIGASTMASSPRSASCPDPLPRPERTEPDLGSEGANPEREEEDLGGPARCSFGPGPRSEARTAEGGSSQHPASRSATRTGRGMLNFRPPLAVRSAAAANVSRRNCRNSPAEPGLLALSRPASVGPASTQRLQADRER